MSELSGTREPEPLVLLASEHWQIARPAHFLTEGHLALRKRPDRTGELTSPPVVVDLLAMYRIARGGLREALGCDGFGMSFAWSWKPYGHAIGEPVAEWGQPTVHVFGRSPYERVKPVRVMAVPAHERPAPISSAERETLDDRLITAFATYGPTDLIGLDHDDGTARCDGCAPEVEHEQELWRADGVRVIRPRNPLVPANVLVLPLRHVVSPASLRADEVGSFLRVLGDLRGILAERFGSSGLSCFLNDGARSGQETPHVHVHVFGRAVDEARNPFEVLASRIGVRLS